MFVSLAIEQVSNTAVSGKSQLEELATNAVKELLPYLLQEGLQVLQHNFTKLSLSVSFGFLSFGSFVLFSCRKIKFSINISNFNCISLGNEGALLQGLSALKTWSKYFSTNLPKDFLSQIQVGSLLFSNKIML